MRKKFTLLLVQLISSPCLMAQPLPVAVNYTLPGSIYQQNFDSLPATGSFTLPGKGPIALSTGPIHAKNIQGWQIWMYGGSNPNAGFAAGTGSATGNGAYSFGASGSGERALGSLATGTGIYALGLILTNQTGILLNRFSISLAAEQWRKGGSANKNTWAFRYKTGSFFSIDQAGTTPEPGLNFSSVVTTGGAGSLNGNLPANRQRIQYTVDSLLWKPGEQLLLRWDDWDESGNDDAVAIDDFSFTAELVSAPPSLFNLSLRELTADAAIVTANADAHFSTTIVWVGIDADSSFNTTQWVKAQPDSIEPGTGRAAVQARITRLAPGTKYYYKWKATNARGIAYSKKDSFTTSIRAPEVITRSFSRLSNFSIKVYGQVTASGGAEVTARGVVWAVNTIPRLTDHLIHAGKDTGSYALSITDLPAGSIIYIRAYALNAGGASFGDTIRISTPTFIRAIRPLSPSPTHAAEISFAFQTMHAITGLSSHNFSLRTNGVSGASIKTIDGSGSDYTLTVQSGSGDGTLGIQFSNDSGISLPVQFSDLDTSLFVSIDKTPPLIRQVSIPDRPMKIGDTIPVQIVVWPDSEVYDSLSGFLQQLPLTSVTRSNDSTYTAYCIITAGAGDLAATEPIPIALRCTDKAGNTGTYTSEIIQSQDAIDASTPYLVSAQSPAEALYKAGDSLLFRFRFSEPVKVENGIPSLTLTVGIKARNAVYLSGSGSDSLVFRYVINKGDIDTDGIKTAGTLTLNKSRITDLAGNTAKLNFQLPAKHIRVDGIIPQLTHIRLPYPGEYTTGDTLWFQFGCSKKLQFNCKDSLPSLEIRIGNKTRKAVWQNCVPDSILRFYYRIEWMDRDTSGIQLNSFLTDNGSCFRDTAGNPLSLLLPLPGNTKQIRINTPTLRLEKIIAPANGWYKAGDTLAYTVQFNEPVQVNTAISPPYITVTIGKTGRQAKYQRGAGTHNLVFAYIIQSGDTDSDGIETADHITLNGSSITDNHNQDAPLYFHTSIETREIRIDASPPVLSKIMFPAAGFYKEGDTLRITLQFSEPVLWNPVADTPAILLNIGTIQKKLDCQSQPGSSWLAFSYQIQKNELDKKGIVLGNKLLLTGNQLTDLAGNKASLLIRNDLLQSNVFVDAQSPTFLNPQDQSIEKCMCRDSIPLASLLACSNSEQGETISWAILHIGKTGTIATSFIQAVSNGKNNIPTGLYFRLNEQDAGTDTLHIRISDGINQSAKKIIITVLPTIQNNVIGNAQLTCAGKLPEPISGSIPSGGNGQYRYVWEMAPATDTLSFSRIHTGDTKDMNPVPLQSSTWFRRSVYAGACADTATPVKIEVVTGSLWEGKQDSDWNNVQNWCLAKTPDAFTDAYLIYPKFRFAPLISNQAVCRNLFIRDSGSLHITGTLRLYGRIESAQATIDATKGRLQLKGNTTQLISGAQFRQRSIHVLSLDNAAGAEIKDSLIVLHTLSLNRGKLETGNLLFLAKEASMAAMGAAAAIAGTLTATHLLPGGSSGFRLIGNPFSESLALHLLTPYMDIAGEGGSRNGFTDSFHTFPTAYWLDPLRSNDSSGADAGWTAFNHTNGMNENAWKRYRGIRLFFRGSKGQGMDGRPAGNGINGTYLPKAVTLTLTGSPQTGEQWIHLPGHKNGTYHCISNPYLSAINMQSLGTGKSIGRYYWLWNPAQGKQGGYTAYPFQSKTILPAFGAFLARSDGDTENHLLFSEEAKTTESPGKAVPLPDLDDLFFADLRLESDSIFWDRLLVLGVDNARTFFDQQDAEKLLNPDVNFYSLTSNARALAIDARPLHNQAVISLGLQSNTIQAFSIRVAKALLPAGNTLMLHDILLDKWMPLATDSSYHFSTTQDSLSFGNKRFEIRSRYTSPLYANRDFLHTQVWPVPATAQLFVRFTASEKGNTTLRILAVSGQVLKQVSYGKRKVGDLSISIADLPNGLYLIETRCGLLRDTKRFIRQ